MRIPGKRRLVLAAGSIAAVGAVGTLVSGVTFGLFSANQAGTASTFATGTLTIGSPVDGHCTITNLVPGDESTGYTPSLTENTQATKDAQCTFAVKYTGSVPAYIGLGAALGNGTLGGSLLWQISDGTNSYTDGNGAINTNSATSPLYVASDDGTAATGQKIYTFTVDYALPTTVTSQNLTSASLTMTAYAVQAGNNGFATTTGLSGGAACTAGTECAGLTHWG